MIKHAYVSPCQRFRYNLTRDWTRQDINDVPPAGFKQLLFVMLNPSTADAVKDDQTIRKCIGFAKAHGFGALSVVNLYALRARNPQALRAADWEVGPENDTAIQLAAMRAHGICLAWGSFAARTPRAGEVIKLLRRAAPDTPLQCLDTTADGHPRHPLYLAGSLRLKPFEVTA